MPGRYVPSHLRGGTASKASDPTLPSATRPRKRPSFSDHPNLHSAEEIRNYFWPAASNDNPDAGRFPPDPGHSKTLHDSAVTPGKLAYLFLFKDANPRWESDGIVYTKSSLELLPDASEEERPDAKDESIPDAATATSTETVEPKDSKHNATGTAGPTQDGPTKHIAIFKQHHRGYRSFSFEGWYTIARLTYLDPQTPELARMLGQKWTSVDRFGKMLKRERDPGAWQASLSMRWAVIKFEKAVDGPEAPKIERVEREETREDRKSRQEKRRKSVNEMLANIRSSGGDEVENDVAPEARDHAAGEGKDESLQKDPTATIVGEQTVVSESV